MGQRKIGPLLGLAVGVVLLAALSTQLVAQGAAYHLQLDIDWESGRFTGQVLIEWQNDTGAALNELFFRTYANAEAIYGPARVEVEDVEVNGTAVESVWYVEDTVLLVPLSMSLDPEQTVSVRMVFSGRPADIRGRETDPEVGYGLFTRAETSLVLTAFYPVLAPYTEEGWVLDPVVGHGDALFTEVADYTARIFVDSSVDAYASGDLVSAVQRGTGMEYVFRADGARDFSFVLAEGLTTFEETVGRHVVRAAFSSNDAGQLTVLRAAQSMATYESRIGTLPYSEVELVEVPLHRVAGVELTGLILVSSDYAQSPHDLFYSVIITHEMAHQWFYAVVGNDLYEHPWLDEGLVTYLSYVVIGDAIGEDAEAEQMAAAQSAFDRAAVRYPDLSIDDPLHRFPDSSTYSSFVYSGGAAWFDAVERLVGEDGLFAGLAEYYETMTYLVATPDDLLDAIEAACACTLSELLAAFGMTR